MSKQKAQHTAGPWRVFGTNTAVFPDGSNEPFPVTVITATVEGIHEETELAYVAQDFPTTETAEANAHLIAAAPEMLEALQLAYNELAQWLGNDAADEQTGKVIDAIAAAIRKARGEEEV